MKKTKTNISVVNNVGIRRNADIHVGDGGPYPSGDILDANATQEAVNKAVNEVIGGAPETLDTLKEIAETIEGVDGITGLVGDVQDLQNRVNDTPKTIINVLYDELVELRDDAQLVPGQKYRIIDYETIINNHMLYYQTGGHRFDIIVTALDNGVLSEDAKATCHDEDQYFAGSNLSAWKIKYTIDNDPNKFDWADDENGKGVIYQMIDEFNNDFPYDFKNIKMRRYYRSGYGYTIMSPNIPMGVENEPIQDVDADNVEYQYTFSTPNYEDATVKFNVDHPHDNKCEANYFDDDGCYRLPDITFINDDGSYRECCNNFFSGKCNGVSLNCSCSSNYISGSAQVLYLFNSNNNILSGEINSVYIENANNNLFLGQISNSDFCLSGSSNIVNSFFGGYIEHTSFCDEITNSSFCAGIDRCEFVGGITFSEMTGVLSGVSVKGSIDRSRFSGDFSSVYIDAGLKHCMFEGNMQNVRFDDLVLIKYVRQTGEIKGTVQNAKTIDSSIGDNHTYERILTGDGSGNAIIVAPYI